MKYLFDTDILINHLRGRKSIDKKLLAGKISVSLITYAELLYGVYRSTNPQKSKSLLQGFFHDLSIEIINLDLKIVEEYAFLKAKLEKKGQRLDEIDLLIAATAKFLSLTLVTENKNHFQRIPNLLLFS